MSADPDQLLDAAELELGFVEAQTVEHHLATIAKRDRPKRAPVVTQLPGIGRTMLGEADGILAVTIEGENGEEPALLIADRGSAERPPLALFHLPNADMLRNIGAFCLEWAAKLEDGSGLQ